MMVDGVWRSPVARSLWEREDFRGFKSRHPDRAQVVTVQFALEVSGVDQRTRP